VLGWIDGECPANQTWLYLDAYLAAYMAWDYDLDIDECTNASAKFYCQMAFASCTVDAQNTATKLEIPCAAECREWKDQCGDPWINIGGCDYPDYDYVAACLDYMPNSDLAVWNVNSSITGLTCYSPSGVTSGLTAVATAGTGSVSESAIVTPALAILIALIGVTLTM